jgi:glycosyltransferase involved in cell wall biosynthesis
MPASPPLSASVVICTYNRANLLKETLESLCGTRSQRRWDVVVVDNNSTDGTRHAVESLGRTLPAPVTYVFEPRQGKSNALNTGIARSRGDILAFTDDDVKVVPGWLEEACRPLDADRTIDYTGGPVHPLWDGVPPRWLDRSGSGLWGTLAILDYGDEPFVFEDKRRVPLGVNMAVRRSLVERIGGFHPELGRRGRTLLGQEQAEFFGRGRACGARGLYVPGMTLSHHVPQARLTKRYFRRWWFYKGLSRARVDAMHQRTELGLDLRTVPYVAGVPRYVWGQLPRSSMNFARSVLTGDRHAAMRHEMHVAYALGYIRACWMAHTLTPIAPVGPAGRPPTIVSEPPEATGHERLAESRL